MENWRVMLMSTQIVVEVEVEIGNKKAKKQGSKETSTQASKWYFC